MLIGDVVRDRARRYRCCLLYAGPEACGRRHGCGIEQQFDDDTAGRHGDDGSGAALRARGCDSFAGQGRTSQNLDSSAAAFKHIADGSRKEVGIGLGRGRIEKAVKSVLQIGEKS